MQALMRALTCATSALILPLLLALTACANAPRSSAHAPPAVDAPSSPEWVQDMARFAAEDAAHPPPAHPIVFTGSSSIRKWTTLAADFPGKPVLNRGFGGSQIRDAVWYADQVAIRYRPRQIVFYAGDNDIDARRDPSQVAADFAAFVARIRRDLPDVPILFVSIKPSLARESQLMSQRETNQTIQFLMTRMPNVSYVDVATPMLGPDGKPRADLFGPDGLHMNATGYALWRGIIAPKLVR